MNEIIKKWIESNYANFIKKNNGILKFDNEEIRLTKDDLDHIVDWLSSDSAERHRKRLEKLSVPDAYKLAQVWLTKMNAKFEKNNEVDQDKEGVEIIHSFKNGFKVVKINSKYSYSREGSKMGHCVGGYYGKDCTIFSLRDSDNEPHCTIEYDSEEKVVKQVKGKGNNKVADRYTSYIIEFINTIPFNKVYDADKFNVIDLGSYLLDLSKPIPTKLVVDKSFSLENLKLDIIFDELVVNGDFKIKCIRTMKQIAKKITVNGDLLIEQSFGTLRLADQLEVLGDVELVDSNQMKILAKDLRIIGNVWLEDMEQFIQEINCDGEIEINDCPLLEN